MSQSSEQDPEAHSSVTGQSAGDDPLPVEIAEPQRTSTAQSDWELIVIGAGAAGLLAAAEAAARGKHVLLLERNRKPGVKILMSGGTRCNLTHDTDARGIIDAFGKPGRLLKAPLAALGPRELVDLFEAEGVATKIEETGKVFPVSDRALDVQQALVRRLERANAHLARGESVVDLRFEAGQFTVATDLRTLVAQRVLVTTGGQSYPGSGTRGDGYAWAASLGHSIVPPRPALVPLIVETPWVRALSGITIPDVALEVVDPALTGRARRLAMARGSFLFTHFGLSGPVVLDVSRAFTAVADPKRLRLQCDFLPDVSSEVIEQHWVAEAAEQGRRTLVDASPWPLPARLIETMLQAGGCPPEQRLGEFSRAARQALVRRLKQTELTIVDTKGFGKAEVTAGGVALEEIDFQTMQSRRVPGLYFAGEVLDLDGPIGGYNFQAAFSTGWLAGHRV